MSNDLIFSSESVTRGHPDKLCDAISDAIVDAYLYQDPDSRAAVECAIASGVLFIASRATSVASVNLPSLARGVISAAGYTGEGFDARNCSILTSLTSLPPEPREDRRLHAANDEDDMAALDHVNAFGFACTETPELMPAPIMLAHRLVRLLDGMRETAAAPFLAPDGKVQVAVAYRDGVPVRVRGLTITTAVTGAVPLADIRGQLELAARNELGNQPIACDGATEVNINPGDILRVGGPAHHAGLTGRKTAIDTYGEYSRQSSAALSGKDPFRIDRIGAYAARHAALNIVAAGLAGRCEVHLSYEIGRARPASISVETFGTGSMDNEDIVRRLSRHLDFRPMSIIRRFGLNDLNRLSGSGTFYARLAVYGQMGRRDISVPWEQADVAEALAD
jgi:S-adenosylmethionine synthetase